MKPDFNWRASGVYLDNAATTLVSEEVVESMLPFLSEKYGNTETVYSLGRESREAVEGARRQIADAIGCSPSEVFFTSGGTESNNWSIFRSALPRTGLEKTGVCVSATEHYSVIVPAMKRSVDEPFVIPVKTDGVIDLTAEAKRKISESAIVSVHLANNETGTLQPVSEVAALCKKSGTVFHCDAVQALGKIPVNVREIGADLLSLSAHKIHGPMGIGALYIKKGTSIDPLIYGGGQESGMRSGTLPVPEIVGFGVAVEQALREMPSQMPRVSKMRQLLESSIVSFFKGAKLNGHPSERLPNIISVTLPGVEAEVVVGILSEKYGVSVSTGSACSVHKRRSHVLAAMGLDDSLHLSTLRFSLSRYNTEEEIKTAFAELQRSVLDSKRASVI